MSDMATASAPATTANLGPAFDSIGLALGVRCGVRAVEADEWSIEHVGEHRPEPGGGDGVLAAARRAVGERPLALTVESDIPIGKGLGSSAAAFVAGTAAALRAVGEDAQPDRVFRLARELEGHDDQVGAAVYGGLILIPAEGLPMRLPFHPSLRPVVGVPTTDLPTFEARAILSEEISRDVVIRSLGRVSALTAGLITGDSGMLSAAHGDEIHEAPRAHLSPEVGHLMDVARAAGALHAARSGAGPSVLAIATSETADRIAAAFVRVGASAINQPMETTGLV